MSRTSCGLAALGVAVLLSGCAAGADKAGSEALVLRLATIDGQLDPSGGHYGQAAFVEALDEVSGGRIEVDLQVSYGDGDADAEPDLVRAIADGEVDGGWPSTRAFAGAGIVGMGAIEAPLMLTNYEALAAIVEGPAGEQVLAALDGTGIAGLGVTIAELRRPFAVDPLIQPSDWQDVQFRSFNSPVQTDTITALGGQPVSAGVEWQERVEAGELDGAELGLGVGSIVAAGILNSVTANVVLWPKLAVLSMNREFFDGLSEEQRGWIEDAARAGVDAALGAEYDESGFVEAACKVGIRFVDAPEEAIAALRQQVQPVIDALSADPAERDLLDAVAQVATEHPGIDVPVIPASCRDDGGGEPEVAGSTAPIPDGMYRVDVSLDDLDAAGMNNANGYTGTWTITVDDGTYAYTCRPNALPDTDCGNTSYESDADYAQVLEAGHLRGDDRSVQFVYDEAVHRSLADCGECETQPTKHVGWVLEGDQLTFTDIGEPVVDGLLIVEPWTKVG